MLTHERFVDDADGDGAGHVPRVERTSLQDRHVDCLEVTGTDDLHVGTRALTGGGRRLTFNLEVRRALVRATQRQRRGPGDVLHAGDRPNLALDGPVELQLGLVGRILVGHRVDDHAEHLIGAVATIDALDGQQGAQQQSGADQQDDDDRYLSGDEELAHTAAAARRVARSRGGLCRRERAGVPGGCDAEQQSDQYHHDGAEHGDARVDGECQDAREQLLWHQRRHDAQDGGAHQQAEKSADGRQRQAFGHQLPDDAAAVGAKRGTHRELALPHGGAGHQQAGDVGAAHQQHQSDHADEQDRRLSQFGAEDRFVQRLEPDRPVGVGVGELASEGGGHRLDFALADFARHTRTQPTDRDEPVAAASAGRRPLDRDECPEVAAADDLRRPRHHADDCVRVAIEPYLATDDVLIGAEALTPEVLAEHHHVPLLRIVGWQEHAAGKRLHAERGEDVGGHPLPRHVVGQAIRVAHHHPADVGREAADRGETAASARPIEHVQR